MQYRQTGKTKSVIYFELITVRLQKKSFYYDFDAFFFPVCGLSLLLVLSFAPRGFSLDNLFPLSSKTNTSKFQFDQESGRRRTTLWMCYLQIIIYLFNYSFFTADEVH